MSVAIDNLQVQNALLIFNQYFPDMLNDIEINLIVGGENGYSICKNKSVVDIKCSTLNGFVSALGYLISHNENKISITRKKNIERVGIMLDAARNAVPNLRGLKEFALNMALLGYDYLEIYTEDCFEVPNEPYFGYMRGKYSQLEIKELDDFCKNIGIELVPCIQTLAHYDNIFRHEEYAPICDIANILLLEEDRTYVFLENIFKSVRECFSSNRINIGMDEAHLLGLGKYLDKNGYQDRVEIFTKHLEIISELCLKYNFEPSMWSDMFFRLAFNGEYENCEQKGDFDESIKQKVPKNINLIYWDYFHDEEAHYNNMFRLHKQLSDKISFAGCVWKMTGYAPNNEYSIRTLNPAVNSCINNGIDDFLLTAWGDNGGDGSYNAIFASAIFVANSIFDNGSESNITNFSKALTGYSFNELLMLDLPNKTFSERALQPSNSSKYMLFNDLLIDIFYDRSIVENSDTYMANAKKLDALSKNKSKHSYLFNTMSKLCAVLEKKSNLGKKIKTAYDNKNFNDLSFIVNNDLQEVLLRLADFYEAFEYQWFKENKSFGFEVQDARLGGLKQRIIHIGVIINRYINGEIDKIEELEQVRLPISKDADFTNKPDWFYDYKRMVSFCSM